LTSSRIELNLCYGFLQFALERNRIKRILFR